MENQSTNATLKANRPKPINLDYEMAAFSKTTNVEKSIQTLLVGEYILVEEFYTNGLLLLNGLKSYLHKKHKDQSFIGQRAFRSDYKELSNLVLLKVKDQQLLVKKAPVIGWLKKLYLENNDFHLSFPQVQGLNSAWQWYLNGVSIPVLRNKIHPYYGVYFPTRFEHLQLFDNWLKRYDGAKKTAIDIGIGSGVLSLLLMKHGFQKSFGTDMNPNAIIGLQESMNGTKLSRKIEIDCGHLFSKWNKATELIIFNPPWLPSSHDLERLDEAIYYNEKLFPEFFKEAKKRLLPDGRIVLLFSNLGQITKVTKRHPIENELKDGGRFTLDKFLKKKVKPSSDKTKRNQHWRDSEFVELWVLKHA